MGFSFGSRNSKAAKSAKCMKKKAKLACGSDSCLLFHNADSAGLRVTTLPARFTPKENPAYAGSWKIVVTVHTPLSREVFWHEYAKIPRHTSQNSIAAAIWNEFWLRYCERSEQ